MMNDECGMMNGPAARKRPLGDFFSGLSRAALTAVAMLAFALPSLAEESAAGLKLLDQNTLAGWQYGDPDTSGWSVKDGVLHADSPKHTLLSGWTFGDFELRFDFVASKRASLTLSLETESEGHGPTVAFNGSDGKLTGAFHGPTGMSLGAPADRRHSAVLAREGTMLHVSIDGLLKSSMSIPGSRFGLSLSANGVLSVHDLEVTEPAGEPIFNGRDLAGWYTIGNPQSWLAEDGKIVLVNKDGNYLRTEKLYENFTLSLEYKIARGGNSGVGIRTPRDAWPSGDGMELQILDEKPGTPMTRHSTMAIYGNLEPLAKADKSDEWNRATIKAEGYMISAWINGVLVQQADTSRLPELKHRHLKGWIGLQDHNAHTEFRNLQVLEAPPGLGLAAWQKPRPLPAAALVLNRLMNLDSLTLPDDTISGAVTKLIASEEEQVVAELKGPGAVVEIDFPKTRGQVAMHFDGNAKPAVDCPVAELAARLPLVGPPKQTLLTYVPFKESLKITARKASDRFRLVYVQFPKSWPVETFAGPDNTVARGWLPAISYRYQQAGWGTLREYDEDLDPRTRSKKQTIEPGQRVSLVKLSGGGIVEWFKLHAPNKPLANQNLWLEVRVDGQKAPAIAAPVRFLFPGLAGGRYENFVVTHAKDHGYVNRLAMPFLNGIELSAVNRGKKPIEDVELSVSVDRNDDLRGDWSRNEPFFRYRLRGVYQSKPKDDDVLELKGNGRWVGLVCGEPPRAKGESASAKIIEPVLDVRADSQPVAGWSGETLGVLFDIPKVEKVRNALAGRTGGLTWRWLIESPIEFNQSLALRFSQAPPGPRLLLAYVRQ